MAQISAFEGENFPNCLIFLLGAHNVTTLSTLLTVIFYFVQQKKKLDKKIGNILGEFFF